MSDRLVLFNQRWLRVFFELLVFSYLIGASIPIIAQEPDEEDVFTLEEITVTAEKREAELQKVPIDISVVRPDEMDRLGITTAYDMKKIIPDINTDAFAGSNVVLSIRGVGGGPNSMFNPIHETSTSVNLDGVQLTRVNGFDNMFYDLQRVEVLKGPQGTLYGRGSTGGSMNIMTQKPILGELGGNLGFEYGNYGLKMADAAINIPVTDKLALRASGRIRERDGYSDAGFNDQDVWGARLSMTWEPTEKDTVTMVYDAEGSRNKGYMSEGTYIAVYSSDPKMSVFTSERFPSLVSDYSAYPVITYSYGDTAELGYEPQTWNTNVINIPNKSAWWLGNASNMADINNKSWGFMSQWEHEFSFAYGVAVYGHRVLRETKAYVSGTAPGATPIYSYDIAGDGLSYTQTAEGIGLQVYDPPTGLASYSRSYAYFDSLEMRLLSKETITAGDKYEWVAGVMGQNDKITEDATLGSIQWINIKTNSYGLFGQASYQIVNRLNLSLGYRYSIDEKKYHGIYPGYWGTDPTVDNFPQNFPHELPYLDAGSGDLITDPTQKSLKWTEHTYKANLNWNITDEIMTYVQYSKGYRTGNFGYSGEIMDPEYLDSYEIGFKSRFFDNRVQLNTTGYYYDYKNYSTWATAYKCKYSKADYPDGPPVPVDNSSSHEACWDVDQEDGSGPDGEVGDGDFAYNKSTSVSAGGAEQMGVSANIIWLVTPNDSVTFNGSWQHNEYKNYNIGDAINAVFPDNDNVAVNEDYQNSRDGEEFGGSPYRFNMSYSHTTFIGADILSFNTTAFYNGKGLEQRLWKYTDREYTMPGLPDYWTMDVSLSYSSSRWVPEKTRWSTRFWCNNIFDSHHLSSMYYSDYNQLFGSIFGTQYENMFPERTGVATGSHITPRTFGVSISFDF